MERNSEQLSAAVPSPAAAAAIACPSCGAVHSAPEQLAGLVAGLEVAVSDRNPSHASLYTGNAYKLHYQYPANAALLRIARLLERLDREPDLAFVEKALDIAYGVELAPISFQPGPLNG